MAEEKDENLDSQNEEENIEGNGGEDEDDLGGVEETDDVEKLKEQNAKLFSRAKHAEGFVQDKEGKWVKNTKPADVVPKPAADSNTNAQAQVEADELRLIARGFSDEEVAKAKVIAKGSGISLIEAVKDDLFLTFQKDFKEKQRKEDAKLGASRGSGQGESGPAVSSGMEREDHKAAFNKALGKK